MSPYSQQTYSDIHKVLYKARAEDSTHLYGAGFPRKWRSHFLGCPVRGRNTVQGFVRVAIKTGEPMKIDIWSDIICPFCTIGKRKLDLALAETGIHADIEWHSFELNPDAPPSYGMALPTCCAPFTA